MKFCGKFNYTLPKAKLTRNSGNVYFILSLIVTSELSIKNIKNQSDRGTTVIFKNSRYVVK